jgi:hypothetical protein
MFSNIRIKRGDVKPVIKDDAVLNNQGHTKSESMRWGGPYSWATQRVGNRAYLSPGAGPGLPTKGRNMRGENRLGFPPRSLRWVGLHSGLPMAFFGAFAPHEQFRRRRLEEADEESEEVFEEVDEAEDEFAELIEYLDNQRW